MEVKDIMGRTWHLFPGIYRNKSIRNCLRGLESNEDYTIFYDDGIFQFERKRGSKKIVCEISVGAFYDICNGLYDKTEINNRINDFILQQLYLKGVELE